MDKDRMEGMGHQAKGAMKEADGKLTGDKKTGKAALNTFAELAAFFKKDEPEKAPEPPKVEAKEESKPAGDAPKSGKDWYEDGRKKVMANDTDGAIASFKSAASKGYGKAYGQLARLYFGRGDKGACASAAKNYLDRNPDAGDAPTIQGLLEKCSN